MDIIDKAILFLKLVVIATVFYMVATAILPS